MKRSPLGKTACSGAGTPVSLGFGAQSAGATLRRACPACGQIVRVLREEAQGAKGALAKHKRALTEEEWAGRKAAVVVEVRARLRPSALAE